MTFLSVFIPAYNEEAVIVSTLQKVKNYLEEKGVSYELYVVDDGSKDTTRDLVLQQGIALNPARENRGKGRSVNEGVFMAEGEWVLFLDADYATPIEMFERFIPHMQTYPIIIASREMKESQITISQPFLRSLAGKAVKLLIRSCVVPSIQDTQCGFKLFKTQVAKNLFAKQTLFRWLFDAEILFIARTWGYEIKEVPIVWTNSPNSKLSMAKEVIRTVSDLFKIRINSLRGKYKKI